MAKSAGKKTRANLTAADIARQQREISISEFFTKNRHLLGFDNPKRALLTTVKEAVDNAIDACEEAGILPEIWVHVQQMGNNRFKIGGDAIFGGADHGNPILRHDHPSRRPAMSMPWPNRRVVEQRRSRTTH